jgi:hypothetical protein
MTKRQLVVSTLYYVGLAGVLAFIWLDLFSRFLPAELATRIGYNSEGFMLALLLAAWIQFVRPRLAGTSRGWLVSLLVAAGFLVVGFLLLTSDLPSMFVTLNETCFGLSPLIIYLQARRPLPNGVAATVAVTMLSIIALSIATDIVINLAETFVMLLLAPVAFDLVDRGILDRHASTSSRLRYGWYAVLILVPITFSTIWHSDALDPGLAYRIVNYEVRTQEAFVGILLTSLYFAVALGRTGRQAAPADISARLPA